MAKKLNVRWLFRMALRDSRKSLSRLLLSIISVMMGIGALVAINSFSENLNRDINSQVGTLLGADMSISSRFPPDSVSMAILDSLPGDRASEISFNTMIFFPENMGTRFIQVRAIEEKFPFYGQLETLPLEAASSFRNDKLALVEETLLLQFDAAEGDSIRIGKVMLEVEGRLFQAPGQSGFSASVAPVVYMPIQYVEETGLIRPGSRIIYKYFYQFPDNIEVVELAESIRPKLEAKGFRIETLEDRKRGLGNAYKNLATFLSLVAFIALLLGCLGVASAVNVYLNGKLPSVATLRCLGLSRTQTFTMYLIQIAGTGLVGGLGGALAGSFLQQLLPYMLKDFLVVEVSNEISWISIIGGISLGMIIAVLFALIPLLQVRKVSPLSALRQPFEETTINRDIYVWIIYGVIFLFVFTFAYIQIADWKEAAAFSGGMVVFFLILWGIALLLMKWLKKYLPLSWPYLLRQSISNLYRPQNQTILLIVSIGLGTIFISTMFFVQQLLLSQVNFGQGDTPSNIILFGIQANQQADLVSAIEESEIPLVNDIPVITMRLKMIGSRTAEEVLADSTRKVKDWVFRREYRTTYRSDLTEAETVVEGNWVDQWESSSSLVPISMEEEFAKKDLKVSLGDTLTFDVQGAELTVVVGSLRKLDYNKDPFSFYVVFPVGVLEKAPQFRVMFLNEPDIEKGAKFQRKIAQNFPTVAIIDLRFVMQTIDNILNRVSFVIQFMALLSMITGLIVLISSVVNSKYQRIKESVLLRTIGANRSQILKINAGEYMILGLIASIVGVILSLIGTYFLAIFSFDATFVPDPIAISVIIISITMLTTITGLFNIRSVLRKPPLEILRENVD